MALLRSKASPETFEQPRFCGNTTEVYLTGCVPDKEEVKLAGMALGHFLPLPLTTS